MSLSMYQASIPVFVRYLSNLRAILEKAEQQAEAKKFDPQVLLSSRLFPDMYPLTKQIQLVSDMAKSGASRLAGADMPRYEDTETTFADLYARIDKTLAHVKSFTPEQIDGSEDRAISIHTSNGAIDMQGQPYLTLFLIPNFMFHISTAFAILRHNGIELGKRDFLGATQ